MLRLAFILLVVFLCSCASIPEQSLLGLSSTMKQELLAQDVILIGERHDNKQHHDFQGQVIDFLRSENRLGNIYLEHLNKERADGLQRTPPSTAEQFARTSRWEESGWPPMEIFSGLFKSLVKGGSLHAVGIDRGVLVELYQGNDPGLIPSEATQTMNLDKPLPEPQHGRLLNVLLDSHCGQLSTSHGELMLQLQRYRDAYMALRYEPAPGKIAVYLVGAGHSNKFYGVPQYLRKLHPNLNLLSIELLERGSRALSDESDWVISTEPTERKDPCADINIREPKTKI